MNGILQIFKITRNFWRYYVGVGALVVFTSALGLVNPFITGSIVDTLASGNLGEQEYSNLIGLLALIIGVDVISTILTNISGFYGDKLASLLNSHLSKQFYRHILELEVEYFDNELSGR